MDHRADYPFAGVAVSATLNGKAVLVTGATGFLGSALVRRLVAEGAHVRALARSPRKAEAIREIAEIVTGDITDAGGVQEAAQGCDYVFHAAAAFRQWEEQQRVNVDGTHNVALAAANASVQRLIHVSSIAVYGYEADGVIVEEQPLTPTPNEPYSITKAEAEHIVREISEQHGLSYAIIRPGMIYGPGSGQWTDTMFKIARRRPVIWAGDGSGSTFPIHVDDVVDMMIVMATHGGAHNEAFNCVDDVPVTWREFLLSYAQLAGHQRWLGIPPVLVKGLARVIATVGPPMSQMKAAPDALDSLLNQRMIDMTKAHAMLGWQPQIDLQTGIESCVPYLRAKGWLN